MIAAPRSVMAPVLCLCPSATGRPIPQEQCGELDADASWCLLEAMEADVDAMVFGPGLGIGSAAAFMLERLLDHDGPPLLVDADGLRLAPLHRRRDSERPLVLTPHPGEFRVLANGCGIAAPSSSDASRTRAARELATALRAVVVLKGHRTVVATAEDGWTCEEGGVELAIPGSGDVLAGIIGSVMAQQRVSGSIDPFKAARVGVSVHARAGQAWRNEHGDRGMLASELADRVPESIRCLHGID
jgi:NAD(P)H-hydrate epimerase